MGKQAKSWALGEREKTRGAMARFRSGLMLVALLAIGFLGWEAQAGSLGLQGSSLAIGNQVSVDCTLHVSVDGSDAQTGTEQQPFRTIQHAADQARPGEVICVRPGSYDERVQIKPSGTIERKIVFWAQGAVVTRGFTILADYIRVEGFEITDTPVHQQDGNGIYVQGRGNEILQNTIHHTRMDGIACTDREPFCNDTVIQGNVISYSDGSGIKIFGSNNLVEENDISHSINAQAVDADGIRFFGQGHVIRNNSIHDIINTEAPTAHTDCFQTFDNGKPPTKDILIEGNTCQNVDHQCIMASAETKRQSMNITFRNNVCDNGGWQAIYVMQIPNVTIVNNTFSDRLRGSRAIVLQDGARNASIMNNIFFGSYSAYVVDESSLPGLRTDYNLKYPAEGNKWNELHGLWGINPQFIDPEKKDFHLQVTSPAIDAGAFLQEVTMDLEGIIRPQGSGYDIGAYEYVDDIPDLQGDLNLDGIVDERDVQLSARVALGIEGDAGIIKRADLNIDGIVDILDVQEVINLIIVGTHSKE